MRVTHGMSLFRIILLVLVGHAWGFGISKTWKRLGQTNNEGKLSLEDIPPSYCSMATPSTWHYFVMYFFDVVDVLEVLEEGELSRADGEDAEEP